MHQHIIIIGSSYLQGKRIAWHYSDKEISKDILSMLNEKTKSLLGRPNYSVHKMSTLSKEWTSVVEKDSFFEDFYIYTDLDVFLQEILIDKKISALDIAKYLLSIQPMSNLKLQKIIYLVYADYLLRTQKPLFSDKIIAFQYGPVVRDVYNYYKGHGRDDIEEGKENEHLLILDEITIPVTLAKILQSDEQESVLLSIKSVLEKFGAMSANQLVYMTHKSGSPWDRTSPQGIITDKLILKYHNIEIA